eukprot:752768-Hanusia_phi.AAC.4
MGQAQGTIIFSISLTSMKEEKWKGTLKETHWHDTYFRQINIGKDFVDPTPMHSDSEDSRRKKIG